MTLRSILLIIVSLNIILLFHAKATFQQPKIIIPNIKNDWKIIKSYAKSTLYSITPTNMNYLLGAPFVMELKGNRSEVGYAAGILLGVESSESYHAFMQHKFGKKSKSYEEAMDYLYANVLLKHIPKEYEDEFIGLTHGAWEAGVDKSIDVGQQQRRVITLSTLPADVSNIIRLIENDFDLCTKKPKVCQAILKWEEKNLGPNNIPYANGTWPRPEVTNPFSGHCDFLAAWGERTEGGRLISTRNLDWDKSTGISKVKLITVYNIDGLGSPYATVGFGALISGAIAGMSKNGMTVSEANLDNSEVSFHGFPWPLRLRYVMENAHNLAEARSIWSHTNNTAAFNFLIGSSSDAGTPGSPAAMALETMKDFTGYFYDNSPIEANATWQWPNVSTPEKIGFPIKDAVWRSNHALHPFVMHTQENLWNDTIWRYKELHDLIVSKSSNGKVLSVDDVVYIVSVLGIKGPNYLSCNPKQFTDGGDNVMSIVYDPANFKLYSAWEDGSNVNNNWSPAACNDYIQFDLSVVFEENMYEA